MCYVHEYSTSSGSNYCAFSRNFSVTGALKLKLNGWPSFTIQTWSFNQLENIIITRTGLDRISKPDME